MSDRGYWKVSTAYSWTYLVKDASGNGITGRASSIVTVMSKDDAYVTTPAITVTEIDATHLPGWYAISYTPAATGHYAVLATDPANDTDGWLDEVQVVNNVNDDFATAVWALSGAIDGTLTPAQALMYVFAAVAGVSAGEPGPGTDTFKGPSGTVRLTTTFDPNNNRSSVVLS